MTIQGTRYYVEVEGRSIELPEGEATVGRSRNCTVAVKDVTVSRHHATICFEGGRAKVRDIGSSNGTFVNGKRVQGEAGLASGDKVAVGETEMQVRIVTPEQSPEATVRIEFGDLFCPRCGAPVPRHAAACVACSQAIAAPTVGPLPSAPPVPVPMPMPPAASAPPPRPQFTPPPFVAPPPPPVAAFGPLPSAPAPVPAPAPARPSTPMAPSAPPRPSGAPATPAPAAVAEPPREMLSSIREIELAPPPAVPAPSQGRATGALQQLAPAGFWVRLAAYLIDVVAMSAVYLLVVGPVWLMGRPQLALNLGSLTMVAAGLALALVGWGRFGTTPGKHLLGLRVVDVAKPGETGIGVVKALIRWLGYMVSGLVFGIGFLLIAFRADKRGLHDLLAGTAVGRRR